MVMSVNPVCFVSFVCSVYPVCLVFRWFFNLMLRELIFEFSGLKWGRIIEGLETIAPWEISYEKITYVG